MPRQKQEIIELRVPRRVLEGAIPGRSARSRYASYKAQIMNVSEYDN